MEDQDSTVVPPPSTPPVKTGPKSHNSPSIPDVNNPSTGSQTTLRLPPPVHHYHGSKPVPTQDEVLNWSSTEYVSFITNYIGGMSEWVPNYLLAYNLSPKPSAFSNALEPRLEVGTEYALRYLANAHYVIAETKRLYSEDQIHDNRLEVDLAPMTPFPLYQEIGHQPTSPHFHMYLDPLVPTDPQIFVMHKVNAMIFWVTNIHNQLYDLQSLRILNTPHQNSHRDNIRAMKTIEQLLRSIESRQKSDFAYLDERSGIIDMDPDTFTIHVAIKDHINTCIRDATTTITYSFKNREHAFYKK